MVTSFCNPHAGGSAERGQKGLWVLVWLTSELWAQGETFLKSKVEKGRQYTQTHTLTHTLKHTHTAKHTHTHILAHAHTPFKEKKKDSVLVCTPRSLNP